MITVMKKTILSCLGLILVLSSCVKEPAPVPTGEAKVRFVNALPGSSAQDYYINDTKKNVSGLVYGESSPYFTFTSGINDFIFTNEGSTTIAAGSKENVPIGASYTIFYVKNQLGQASAAVAPDDNAIVEGKAKVRFIHLNTFLNASIKITNQATNAVFTEGVGLGNGSNYFQVDVGTKFVLAANGVTAPPVVETTLVAGKNYTIWFGGSSSTVLDYHVILQN